MLQVLGLALANPTRRAGGRPLSPPSPLCLKAAEAGRRPPDRLRLVLAGPDSRSRFSIRVPRPRAREGPAGNELADAWPAPARTSLDPTWSCGRGIGAWVTVAWRLASQPTRPSPQSRSPGLPVVRIGVLRGDTEPGKPGLGGLPVPHSNNLRARRPGVRSALRRSGVDRGPIAAEPGPGKQRPSGWLVVSARQDCVSRLPPS